MSVLLTWSSRSIVPGGAIVACDAQSRLSRTRNGGGDGDGDDDGVGSDAAQKVSAVLKGGGKSASTASA